MQHYQQYTAEELALDASFRQWVNDPTTQQDLLWEQWLKEFPNKRQTVEQARIMVLSLHIKESVEIEDEHIQSAIEEILAKTKEVSFPAPYIQHTGKTGRYIRRIAASLALLLCAAGWWYWKGAAMISQNLLSTRQLSVPAENPVAEHINRSPQPMLVSLPDKSTVLLLQNGRLTYSKKFEGHAREVHLVGEAFFEVAKNPQKPFYVYTDEVVTKVLGTSFHIKADPADSQISVVVKTGSVSVFTKSGNEQPSASTTSPDMVLKPNQQLIYLRENKQLVQSNVNVVEMQKLAVPHNAFVFKHAPVVHILSQLAENYNVHFIYQPSQLANCDLTASFSDEPLAVKLDLICGAIGVAYSINGNQITIEGTGCAQ